MENDSVKYSTNMWKLYDYGIFDTHTEGKKSGLLESRGCFVIPYMDVSKYSVERNHQDEAKWVAFFRSVDFALGNTVFFFVYLFCFVFVFFLEPQKISLWFSYHHILCIIYCMIRSGISYVKASLFLKVTWTYDWKWNVFTQTIISSCKAHLIVLHANPFCSHNKG